MQIMKQLSDPKTTLRELLAADHVRDVAKALPMEHFFGDSLYVRQATYPKGTLVIGRVHKSNHVFMLVSGKMSVWTVEGRKVLTAPCIFESKAGVQRVGYAHANSVCINMHGVKDGVEVTIENSEEIFTVEDKASYDLFLQNIPSDVGGVLELEKAGGVFSGGMEMASSRLALEKIESD